jgi:hypothetical protein
VRRSADEAVAIWRPGRSSIRPSRAGLGPLVHPGDRTGMEALGAGGDDRPCFVPRTIDLPQSVLTVEIVRAPITVGPETTRASLRSIGTRRSQKGDHFTGLPSRMVAVVGTICFRDFHRHDSTRQLLFRRY